MENTIIVRHGNYTSRTGNLTQIGEQQIERLAEFIRECFEGTFYFGSSPLPRANQSTNILRNILDQSNSIENLDVLCDEEASLPPGQAEAIHRAVLERENAADNIVLVGHYSSAIDYSNYVIQQEWKQTKEIENIPKGKAVHLYFKNKDSKIIPSN